MDVLYQCKLIYTGIQYESTISPSELNPELNGWKRELNPLPYG